MRNLSKLFILGIFIIISVFTTLKIIDICTPYYEKGTVVSTPGNDCDCWILSSNSRNSKIACGPYSKTLTVDNALLTKCKEGSYEIQD